jgi:D-arabinose 1-dehydrogenase-like Zn-dependent alcohol dehydrogenase
MFYGVCHSDIHTAKKMVGNSTAQVVPGHEIVGRVTVLVVQFLIKSRNYCSSWLFG